VLYELSGNLGVGPRATVLDIGCRHADHAAELARKFKCRVIAIDPLPLHIEKAKKLVSTLGLHKLIDVRVGIIEALPLNDASVDHVWCRDMLAHVDLQAGLAECFRALRPDGTMLIYHVFATNLCAPAEAEFLCRALSFVPENMSEQHFEETVQKVGLHIVYKNRLDSQWREAEIEVGDNALLNQLLYLARMRRGNAMLMRTYGEVRYEVHYASCLLGVYQMLGKLCPTVYVLRKPS
jgi:ubiquinone/menaquinone biosynthesis C-methylase UbiE